MDHKSKDQTPATAPARDSRADRLKRALRENLRRRKMQARERGGAGDTPSTGEKTSLHDDTGDEPDA